MKYEYLRSLQLCEDQRIRRKLCLRSLQVIWRPGFKKTFATVKRENKLFPKSIIAIAEVSASPMLTLSSAAVTISKQFHVIFHNTIPQKPVQHMSSVTLIANIKQGCNVNVETVSAVVSGNVSYQTSNYLRYVSQKLAHNQRKHNQQN